MQQIQDIFNKEREAKKQIKDLSKAYKEGLNSSQEYQENKEKIQTLKARQKQIAAIKEDYASELTKIDDLKIDVASYVEMISDMAVSQLMKGESIEVKDEFDNTYEPVFKVNFKKSN